jgi:ribose/xylose/arabinose/galactoside ABC-type transport system permease subunit
LFGIPVPVAAAAAAILVLHVLLRHTVLGRAWFLIGANETAARFAGVPVRRATFLAYLACGAFVALAAVVLTSRVASGQPNLHPGLPFEAIAACAVGGIPLSGGRGSAAQVAIGALTIAILNNVVVLLNFAAAWQLLLIGTVIVGAVLLQHERLRFLRTA